MTEPTIFDKKPVVLDLEAGDYWWCSCGNSKNQPYCDGAHKGTEFVPVKVTLEDSKKVALCLCKKTNNSPFCDGTHAKL
ncbi:zinc finger CDGSH-type domain protein [Gloeothece citriformis PCC 7424]|uniref:Zinc finger CDGSH-type domain protein n=1 Tax=Gloeothece citriformis (strain PCC 7424) TaxID=65393 RepID=B7K8G2_GLOC7|nr:CDGSH iron-sulfur domain-containing protein [Gloeothece citriformis]ACK69922.1 zinc finger CDGSH-type domain protein [Gloeothece citriformis PCC 7424]